MARAHERNQDEDLANFHWNYVENAGKIYVQPLKNKADLILSGEFEKNDVKNILRNLENLRIK